MTTTADVARRLAAKVFEQRGNNSEVHLQRAELEAVLKICAELTLRLRPDPEVVSETVEPRAKR